MPCVDLGGGQQAWELAEEGETSALGPSLPTLLPVLDSVTRDVWKMTFLGNSVCCVHGKTWRVF